MNKVYLECCIPWQTLYPPPQSAGPYLAVWCNGSITHECAYIWLHSTSTASRSSEFHKLTICCLKKYLPGVFQTRLLLTSGVLVVWDSVHHRSLFTWFMPCMTLQTPLNLLLLQWRPRTSVLPSPTWLLHPVTQGITWGHP